MPAVVHHSPDGYRLANQFVEATLDLSAASPRLAVLTNRITGRTFKFNTEPDCALRLAGSGPMVFLPEWSFHLGSAEALAPEADAGYRQGYAATDFDTADWLTTSALNEFPIGAVGHTTVEYPGYAWYRQEFTLPEAGRGQPITLVLGGSDDQDWLEYWVYLNGEFVGHAAPGRARWHATPRWSLQPGDAAYPSLRFGETNRLAVQARGLDRSSPRMARASFERYSVGTPLYDQIVAVGEPFVEVSGFALASHRAIEAEDQAGVELTLRHEIGLELEARYWVTPEEPILYKSIRVRNRGDQPQTVLELDLYRLGADFDVTDGGWGEVCILGDEVFCGIQHPSGTAEGGMGKVRLRSFPGQVLAPGGEYQSKVAVLGVGPAGAGRQSFLRYLERHGRRRPEFLALYSPYGIYEFAGHDEPTDVTESLVLENLDRLAGLRARGASFDYYVIDCGWNNPAGDLKDFNPQNFPGGPGRIVERVRDLRMRLGLWVSPSHGPAAFRPEVVIPPLRDCGTLPRRPDAADDRPRGALCLAAEPYRTMLREALHHHVSANEVRCFKMDGGQLVCNNPAHGHQPGKYSVEAVTDALLETLASLRAVCPDLMIIWYWGFRSPWLLLHGDTLYEHGVHMEAATPSDTPSLILRQSVTVALDQGADYAWDHVPLAAQDSLGVWITDTRWGNWMKSEGWQDAWVMDLARGSQLAQLWGDISLFDDADVALLAGTLSYYRERTEGFLPARRILASSWSGAPYGYAHFGGTRGMLAIHNPSFAQRVVSLHLGQEAGPLPEDPSIGYTIDCLHPRGAAPVLSSSETLRVGDELSLLLAPFQVVMLEVRPIAAGESSPRFRGSPPEDVSRQLDCQLDLITREGIEWGDGGPQDPRLRWPIRRALVGRSNYVDTDAALVKVLKHADLRDRALERRRLVGSLQLPKTDEPSRLVMIVQLSRDGVFWHHNALFDIIRLELRIDDYPRSLKTTPSRWHEQAGGWSWITFQTPIAALESPSSAQLDFDLYLPHTVETHFDAWLIRA